MPPGDTRPAPGWGRSETRDSNASPLSTGAGRDGKSRMSAAVAGDNLGTVMPTRQGCFTTKFTFLSNLVKQTHLAYQLCHFLRVILGTSPARAVFIPVFQCGCSFQ